MGHGCVLGFLAITLCLVCSVSASAGVSKKDAQEAVDNAKKATGGVMQSAKSQLSQAESTFSRVEAYKQRAENAVSTVEEAVKVNSEAEEIAQKARDAKNAFMKLYASGSGSVQKAVTSMQALVDEAQQLKEKSNIQIKPNDDSEGDYTQTQKKATDLIADVNELQRKLTEALPLNVAALAVERNLEKPAEEAQLARYHVDAFVAVTNIATMLREADATIRKTEQKRDGISEIVAEMNGRKQNILSDSISYINSLCSHAEGYLNHASDAINEAQKDREAIQKHKEDADKSLAKVSKETDVDEAGREAERTQWLVREAAKESPKIDGVFDTVDIDAQNAELRKQSLIQELSKSTNRGGTKDDKATKNPEQPPSGGPPKPAGKVPERTVQNKPEQPLNGGTTKPADDGAEEKVENNQEEPAQSGTTKPADNDQERTVENNGEPHTQGGTAKPADNVPELELENNEREPVHGGTIKFPSKEGILTLNRNVDNSITVTFSLLLGVVACAALY